MKEGTPRSVMADLNQPSNPQRRRSPRLTSPLNSDNKMAQTSVAVKRSITVRKIAPRKTAPQSDPDKENTPRRAGEGGQKKPKVSTPGPVGGCRASSSSSSSKKKAAMPSPILPSSPPASSQPPQPAPDPEDTVWSQKVRRSYSRLSDPDPRDTLFGFEKLKTPEVARRVEQSRSALEASRSGLNSFTSLLEAEDCGSAPDPNIPGVVVVRERRRRRRKVQEIETSELEELAARMNAEFEEAEEFQLVVE